MKEKIKIPELDIEVEDLDEYESEADEILTAFCEGLEAEGETRPVDGDELWWAKESGWAFVWTSRASKLITAKLDELYIIGVKYFGKAAADTLDISTHMFQEP